MFYFLRAVAFTNRFKMMYFVKSYGFYKQILATIWFNKMLGENSVGLMPT